MSTVRPAASPSVVVPTGPPEPVPGAAAVGRGTVPWRGAGLVALFWFGFFALIAPASIIEDLHTGANLARDLASTLYSAALWSAASPVPLWLIRRFPVEGPRRWPRAALHVAGGAVLTPLLAATCYAVELLQFGERKMDHEQWSFAQVVLINSAYLLFIYLAFVAIAHAVRLLRRYEEREKLLAQAQLQALKAQLNPHFLYNTLNAVSEFAYKDAAVAERLIAMLSDLLRQSFAGGDAPKLPLAEELAFVRRYLDIQQLLLEERLQVEYRIDARALAAQVPNFVLQPLVENAVVHGISRRAAVGHIEVGGSLADGELRLWISDDGPGLSAASPRRHGIGLANTRARLAQLYGSAQSLRLESPPGGGFRAELRLPYEPTG
jgi:signal transduction histidine kinase